MKKILLGLIGLLFAVPAVATDLPAGYTELEYIESTGTQYIDTGIKQQDGDEFGLVYQQITLDASYRNLFGAAASGQASEFYISQTSSVTYVGNTSNDGIPHNTNKHTLSWVTTSSSSQNVVVDGQTYVVSVRITPNPDLNVMVFARNASNGKMIGKVYGYYQKRNGEYLINLVPAKNSSGVVGMYDTVSGRFFTNAGTGEFIASPEVSIRIATTVYNSARFSPVVTELNDTIATIRSVVTNTINQTKAIADLQATKQTRPDENCPAGKKCLLVEDDAGQPHWYEIIENAYGLPSGYTALEYIETNGSQYIVLPSFPTASNIDITTDVLHTDGTNEQIFLAPASGIQPLYTTGDMWRVWASGKSGYPLVSANTRHVLKVTTTPTICEFYVDNQKMTNAPNNFFTSAVFSGATFNLGARTVASGGDYYWKGRIYSFYAECDSEECMNLVPAKRNSDNAIGMYDLDDTNPATAFHTNAGSGTFVAGPEI